MSHPPVELHSPLTVPCTHLHRGDRLGINTFAHLRGFPFGMINLKLKGRREGKCHPPVELHCP